MAVKDHTLDARIVDAAIHEFKEHGFHKASLHTIAKRANITTGALYTRYKNKDALFCSLVQIVLDQVHHESQACQSLYEDVLIKQDPLLFLKAIQKEEEVYLRVMFEHYDACILFFCKSEGSSIDTMIKKMTELKAQQTIAFFKQIAKREINLDGIEFIMSEQFYYYRKILEKGYDKEQAIVCMINVEHFLEAGWKQLFEEML